MSEYNIQMNKYNALNAGYDQLYPATKIKNVDGLDTALQNKAPAGYGLGSQSKFISASEDLNNIVYDGWYYFDAPPINAPLLDGVNAVGYSSMLVSNRIPSLYVTQEIFCYSSSEAFNCVLRRCRINGEWKPWEWVNPPMTLGVEYRTTERYLGKPVYVKAFNTGALGQNVVDDVFVDTPNADNIWVSSGTFINTSSGGATPTSIPYHASADDNIVFASAYSGVIHRVYKGSAYTITNMIVVLKYTKSTD